MSPFEVVRGYKPRRPLDLLPMSLHARVSAFEIDFTIICMSCTKRLIKKFIPVIVYIKLRLIYINVI